MSTPSEHSWRKVMRIGRYLLGQGPVVWRFEWTEGHLVFQVFMDSDWAGDMTTRKSTSGGVIALGSHCLKTWSTSQGHQALSSCEAEYDALVD